MEATKNNGKKEFKLFSDLNGAFSDLKTLDTRVNDILFQLCDLESKSINEYKEFKEIDISTPKKSAYKLLIEDTIKEYNKLIKEYKLTKSDLVNGFTKGFKTILNNSDLVIDFRFSPRDNLSDRLDFIKAVSRLFSTDKEGNYKIVTLDSLLKNDFSTPIYSKSKIKEMNNKKVNDVFMYDLKEVTNSIKEIIKDNNDTIKAYFEKIDKEKTEVYNNYLEALDSQKVA